MPFCYYLKSKYLLFAVEKTSLWAVGIVVFVSNMKVLGNTPSLGQVSSESIDSGSIAASSSGWFLVLLGGLLAGLLFVLGFRLGKRQCRRRSEKLATAFESERAAARLEMEALTQNNLRLEQELLLAKESIEESQAASIAKGQFFASMSHEIRTPMNGVVGMCSILEGTELDEQQRSFLETIRGSGEHLLTILNDILDFSKIEAGKLDLDEKSFSLRRLFEEVMSLITPLANEKHLEISLYLDPRIKLNRLGDAVRLRQVFLNFLGNAIKFTDKGYVRVRVNPIESDEQKDWVRVEIEDSGIGIPFEKQDQLFVPFSQVDSSSSRKFAGTGLGLSISNHLTKLMGGEVFVFSLPGKGTIFGIEIPLPEDTSDHSVEVRPDFSGYDVWVWGKSEECSRILDSYLSDLGASIVVLRSEIELREQLKQRGHKPDLLIIDQLSDLDFESLEEGFEELFDPTTCILLDIEVGNAKKRSKCVHLIKPVAYEHLVGACHRALLGGKGAGNAPVSTRSEVKVYDRDLSSLVILLVEDNSVNQKVAKLMLRKFHIGGQLDIVENGELAIRAVEQKAYDLVLMDIQMPVMDGVQATRWIREHIDAHRQPTIVAMTAAVTLLDRENTAAAGMDGFIEKPIQPDVLYREICKALEC